MTGEPNRVRIAVPPILLSAYRGISWLLSRFRMTPAASTCRNMAWRPMLWARSHPKLLAARDEVLADAKLWAEGGAVPGDKQPLDAGFHDLPERLLDEYAAKGAESEVGRIIATANRLAAVVDRAVLLGIGGSYMGARALLEACCHPYYNELSRDARDDRPRICFEGNNVDNDALQGLLDLLPDVVSPGNVAIAGASW